MIPVPHLPMRRRGRIWVPDDQVRRVAPPPPPPPPPPFPFSFWKTSGPPPFNPSSLPLTGFWFDHTSAPMVGKPSAGTSGSHDLTIVSSTAGTALNGHLSSDYAFHVDATGATADAFYTNTAYTFSITFFARTAGADTGGAGSPYFNRQILAYGSVALFGVAFSVAGIDVWQYDGAWHTVRIPCGVGAWHRIDGKYDGTHLHARLDSNPWETPVAVTSGWGGFSINVNTIGIGGASYGNAFDGLSACVELADSVISDGDLDSNAGWVNSTFGLSL